MEIISTIAGLSKALSAAHLTELSAVKRAIETDSVAPLAIVAASTAGEIQFVGQQDVPVTEYAGLLNGLRGYEQHVNGSIGAVGRGWDRLTGQFEFIDGTAHEFLAQAGLREPIQVGIVSAIEWMGQARELVVNGGMDAPFALNDCVRFVAGGRGEASSVSIDECGTDYRLAVALRDLAECEQAILKWCDERGWLITAKRIDVFDRSQYLGGLVTQLPLVGGLGTIATKSQLGVKLETADYEQLAGDAVDVTLVITLVAAPYLLPLGAVSSGAGAFAAQSALTGATIGAIHGGLRSGAISFIRGDAANEALAAAGAGVAQGATLGAISGAVGGAVLYHAGASFRGVAMTGAASGAVTGAAKSGADALAGGGSVHDVAAAAGKGALQGGVLGAAMASGSYALGTATTKIRRLTQWPEGLERPEGLMVRTRVDRVDLSYGQHEVQPGLARHHVKPLSLGGTDTAGNVQMVPTAIHRQPHPPLYVTQSPPGTIFY
jgi:hypothetical protein